MDPCRPRSQQTTSPGYDISVHRPNSFFRPFWDCLTPSGGQGSEVLLADDIGNGMVILILENCEALAYEFEIDPAGFMRSPGPKSDSKAHGFSRL